MRLSDILRSGSLRANEAYALELALDRAAVGTARNGTYVPTIFDLDDPAFWRIVGLYLAEGSCSRDGDRVRLSWSFHPTDESHLVQEVADYWTSKGVKASVHQAATSRRVLVSSRILAGWWTGTLGLGQNCYEQRVPDLIWSQPDENKLALLSGLWEGDGSWSRIGGGPSVVLEMGTASRELADGVLRLLGDLEVAARHKLGRTAKSTVDSHWIVIAGADQVERMLALAGESDRAEVQASIDAQSKRIAPTGYRRFDTGAAHVRVVDVEREQFDGWVYSLEVPDAGTLSWTTGGLVVHNCFPKDVNALKQLAGNSRLPLPAPDRRHRGERAPEAPRRRQARAASGVAARLAGSRSSGWRSSRTPTTCARHRVLSWPPACARRAPTWSATTPWRWGTRGPRLGEGVELADSLLDAVTGADAAVIVTEWGEFRHLASRAVREAMATPLIVDGRNLLDPRQARAAGFAYESVGRPADPADVLRLGGIGRTPSRDRGRPGGRRGHPPSPPHVHDAQVDAADRQPAVPRASGRAPALARRRSDRARLWLQARRDPGPLRLGARVRRRAGAARHRRGHRVCRSRSRHLRAVRRVQRRRPHRSRPVRAGRVPRRPPGRMTIALHPVDDPSRYGVVATDAGGAVTAFIEKPPPGSTPVRTINAGTYVAQPDVLDLIPPGGPVSVEYDVFPRLVGEGLYALADEGAWRDIGTPESYLAANLERMPPGGSSTPPPRSTRPPPSSAP